MLHATAPQWGCVKIASTCITGAWPLLPALLSSHDPIACAPGSVVRLIVCQLKAPCFLLPGAHISAPALSLTMCVLWACVCACACMCVCVVRCDSCHGQAEKLLDSAKEMEDSIAVNLR